MQIQEVVAAAIKAEIDSEVKKAVEVAKRELDRRIPELVSGIAIRVMERVSMERMGNDLVIHVKVEGAKA